MFKFVFSVYPLLFITFILTGCFKKDSNLAPTKRTFYFEKQGFEASFYIPERKCLYGLLTDSSGQKRKAEFNLETKSFRFTTFMEPTQNYSVSLSNDAVYRGIQTELGIDIYNILDSTLYKSHTFSYNFDSCILTNNRIYTISKGIVACTLRVHDMETNSMITSKNLFSSTTDFVVSPDGSKIFSEGVLTGIRSIQITQFQNNTLSIINLISQSISLKSANYKMTNNGSYILFSEGHFYDSLLTYVRTFSPCDVENLQSVFIQQDVSRVGFACKIVSRLYNANDPLISIRSEDPDIYTPIFDRRLDYKSSFYFEYNGEVYRAVNYHVADIPSNSSHFIIQKI